MALNNLSWDEWNAAEARIEHDIQKPSWEQVESAINALHAKDRTEVVLTSPGGNHLIIGGGNGRFILVVSEGERIHLSAVDKTKPLLDVELTVGGQTGVYNAQLIWGLETAIRAARCYWRENIADPSLHWE